MSRWRLNQFGTVPMPQLLESLRGQISGVILYESLADDLAVAATMAGLRAAIEAARWLGKAEEADNWQKEYDDFLQTFRRAAQRDTRTDAHGNHYVPIRMQFDEKVPPQKAQWAFLHSLFPGKVFSANDPLVKGNIKRQSCLQSLP